MEKIAELHEGDFWLFKYLDGLEGLFIDIGANIGQSARSLFAVNDSICVLSFEPNPQLRDQLEVLKQAYPSRFDYCIAGISDRSGTALLTIPEAVNANLTENASFSVEQFEMPHVQGRIKGQLATRGLPGGYRLRTTRVPMVTIDSLNENPLVIKLDIEGFERWALLGAKSTIERCHPIILMENNTDFPSIMELVHSWGYEFYRFSIEQATQRSILTRWPWDPRQTLNSFMFHPMMPRVLSDRICSLMEPFPTKY